MDTARSYTFVTEKRLTLSRMATTSHPWSVSARLIGRDALIDAVVDRLLADGNLALTSDNTPGIGLTTLAIAITQDPLVRAHFSGGVLWASLGKQPHLSAILAQWANEMGVSIDNPIDEMALTRALASAIEARRMLLVIDDAWSLADIRMLQCGVFNCTCLLTTELRHLAREFAGAERTCLVHELTPSAAYDLLHALAPSAVSIDPALAQKAAHAAGGVPLSIKLLAGYLSTAPESVEAVAFDTVRKRLETALQELDTKDEVHTKLQQAIALSLTHLPAHTLRAFYNLGSFVPSPATFTHDAAVTVTQTDATTIDQLIQRNLIEVVAGAEGVLALHPAIASVAQVRRDPKTVARHRAFYMAAAAACRDDWASMHTLYPQLAHAWALAPDEPSLFEFTWLARPYQERAGLNKARISWSVRCQNINATQKTIIAAPDAVQTASTDLITGSTDDLATLLSGIGCAYENLGQREHALAYYARACDAQEKAADAIGRAITLNNIGSIYYELNQFGAALKYLRQSAAIHEECGNSLNAQLGQTYNNLGVICTSLGLAQDAVAYFALSLNNHTSRQDRASEAVTRTNLAKLHHLRGPLSAAIVQMKRVVEIDQLTRSSHLVKHRAKLAQLQGELAHGGSPVGADTSPGLMFSNLSGKPHFLKTSLDLKQVLKSTLMERLSRLHFRRTKKRQ